MDRTQLKLAIEFFRCNIKTLSERITHNKKALRHNQRIASKGLDEPTLEYIKDSTSYYWNPETQIAIDKARITAYHIVYADIRGKSHITKDKREKYVSVIQSIHKRMEEYVKEKQVALIPECACGTGGI